MKLSVCMATHNGARYIAAQLESIVKQLGEKGELVISDDSSTDATLQIIDSFHDTRIRVLPGNTFFNPMYNFENALKNVEGDVIVLSDQDDIWLDNKLAVIRSHFEVKPSRVYTLVLDGQIIDDDGSVIAKSIFETIGSRKGLLKNLYDNTYMGCCMAFTRELLDIALPFPNGIPMHDSWLGLLSELYGTVDFVPQKTIKYRRHAENRSFQGFKASQQIKWRCSLAYHLFKRWRAHSRT